MNIEKENNFLSLSNFLENANNRSVLAHADLFRNHALQIDISKIIENELKACYADYRHTPNLRSQFALNLSIGSWFRIDLFIFVEKTIPELITTHPSDMVFFMHTGADCTQYELSQYSNSIYDPNAKVNLVGQGFIGKGDIVSIECSRSIASFSAPAPTVVVVLSECNHSLFTWQFQALTGQAVCHFNSYPLPTVLEMMAKALGAYGDNTSVAPLTLLLEHQSDTIKWQAATSLLRIDNEAGRRAIRNLASSTNPTLALAAKSTLTNLEEIL